jgi:hypothetical protein
VSKCIPGIESEITLYEANSDCWMDRRRTPLDCGSVALFSMGTGATSQAQITPHSVPLEFTSDRYGLTVNGKPVTVFHAVMNIHFASFDFTGQADVRVTIDSAWM